jgi:hypothetical protein
LARSTRARGRLVSRTVVTWRDIAAMAGAV